MKVAIIVDSTAGLSPKYANHPDIYQVNLLINFPDGTTMIDSVDPDVNLEFYKKLSQCTVLPTTSQPPIGTYMKLMDQIVEKGYEAVFAIHLSSKLSGTFANAEMLMKDYEDRIQSYVVDSKSASTAIEGMVEETFRMLDAGLALDEIYQHLLWLVKQTKVQFMVQDLNNLTKGGRLSSTGALVGNMLKIRPVLVFDPDGNMIVKDKIRSTKKVYAEYVEWAKKDIADNPQGVRIAIAHTNVPDQAQKLQELFEEELGSEIDYSIGLLSPVLGIHTGEGLVGFGVLPRVAI